MRDLGDITNAILKVPLTKGRRIIAIIGPPASGKSTLAADLQMKIPGSCVLPMDGFHLSNSVLEARGLLARKGAPETFDVAGFETLLKAIRTQTSTPFPTFDRAQDRSIPEGGRITASHHTVLVEGNYLLLDTPPWNALHGFWDFSIMLEVDMHELEHRLVQRWLAHGYDHDRARARACQNDLPNARFMLENSASADRTLEFS